MMVEFSLKAKANCCMIFWIYRGNNKQTNRNAMIVVSSAILHSKAILVRGQAGLMNGVLGYDSVL